MFKKTILVNIFVILFTLSLSGCLDFLSPTEGVLYESRPTKITYQIRYGYDIKCSGSATLTIKYDCDLPEVLVGSISNITILNDNYENITIATFNDMKRWNFTNTVCSNYTLGISADVLAESYMVSDLTGENALDIQEMEITNADIISQYCKQQSYNSEVFIDPDNAQIKSVALQIYANANSDNSFVIAKELFKWLKSNTEYKANSGNVQKCSVTFEKKTGDCDDLSFLYISLCRSLNIPARFIRGYLIEENSAVAHAWVEVFVGNNLGNDGWIPVECAGSSRAETEIHNNFAFESADHLRLFEDDGSNESLAATMSGLSYAIDSNLDMEKPHAFVDITNYRILESKKLFINENNRYYQ